MFLLSLSLLFASAYANIMVDTRRPVQIAAAISVNADTISQRMPCGSGAEMSVVVGDDINLFQDMAEQLMGSFTEVTINHQDKFMCSVRNNAIGVLTDSFGIEEFNVNCHRRRFFGGCSPADVLRYFQPDALPYAASHCQSHRIYLPQDKFTDLRKTLYHSKFPPTCDERLVFNTTESLEKKTWYFHDGKISKHMTSRFLDTQPIRMFGTLYDRFLQHETSGRFVMYMCKGVILPEKLVKVQENNA